MDLSETADGTQTLFNWKYNFNIFLPSFLFSILFSSTAGGDYICRRCGGICPLTLHSAFNKLQQQYNLISFIYIIICFYSMWLKETIKETENNVGRTELCIKIRLSIDYFLRWYMPWLHIMHWLWGNESTLWRILETVIYLNLTPKTITGSFGSRRIFKELVQPKLCAGWTLAWVKVWWKDQEK